jgi:hypothetical protein
VVDVWRCVFILATLIAVLVGGELGGLQDRRDGIFLVHIEEEYQSSPPPLNEAEAP